MEPLMDKLEKLMAQHTKGKWKVVLAEENSNQYQAGKITRRYDIKSKDFLLATIWREDEFRAPNQKTPIQAEQDANAKLMASAKDLLEQCIIALHCAEDFARNTDGAKQEAWQYQAGKLKKAIKNATE